jgi:hypothetical protein
MKHCDKCQLSHRESHGVGAEKGTGSFIRYSRTETQKRSRGGAVGEGEGISCVRLSASNGLAPAFCHFMPATSPPLDRSSSKVARLFVLPLLLGIVGCLELTYGDISDATRDLSDSLPVFRGAEGFGTDTPAGRGGVVLRVTTLAADGPGSLKAALETPGPRTVLFEVAGNISLTSDIQVFEPYVTVAGQTAPSPGITLKGAGLQIRTHDVLVQHLRMRVGDAPAGEDPEVRDSMSIVGEQWPRVDVYGVVVDHCSVSWGVDETFSTWYAGVRDLTIANSIISEGLAHAGHPEGEHSKGLLVGDHNQRIAVIGNLMVHNRDRNPLVKGDASALVVNNLVYDHGIYPVTFGGKNSGPAWGTVVGNVLKPGASSTSESKIYVVGDSARGTRLFLADNRSPQATEDPWDLLVDDSHTAIRAKSPPVWVTPLTVRIAADLVADILENAGARPADRDDVDLRIVNDVKNGTGQIINSQDAVGGWPDLPEVHRSLEAAGDELGVPFPISETADADGDGYTDLEEWLHAWSAKVEIVPPADPDASTVQRNPTAPLPTNRGSQEAGRK